MPYQGGTRLWVSKTGGNPGAVSVFQGDSNLVVYSEAGTALWSSRTNQKANANLTAVLIVHGDENLVLYEWTPVNKVLWAGLVFIEVRVIPRRSIRRQELR